MAKLSAHGNTVLARARNSEFELVLRSDGKLLQRIFYDKGSSGYSIVPGATGRQWFDRLCNGYGLQ